MENFFDISIFDFVSQCSCTRNCLSKFCKKIYVSPVIPIGEKCVSDSA